MDRNDVVAGWQFEGKDWDRCLCGHQRRWHAPAWGCEGMGCGCVRFDDRIVELRVSEDGAPDGDED